MILLKNASQAVFGPVILITLIGFSGCLFSPKERDASAIIPLAVGNAWSYRDTAYFGGDSVSVESTSIAITGTRTVELGGKPQTVFLWNVRNPAGQPGAVTLWLQNRPDGNHTVGAQQDTASFAFETLHVKYPAKAGDRYPTYFLSFRTETSGDQTTLVPALDTLEIEVVNPDSTCAMPAGAFPCVHYRGWKPGGVLFADTYYAPGVGFLGSTLLRTIAVNGTDREVIIVRRLVSYTLNLPD